jgi:acetyl-CoA carboxylase biotin carboxylase subunit
VQRRYQKVIEEAPAIGLDPALRDAIHESAVRLGRELNYLGAGTVEFLVDSERGTFSFLEINTRVQVEHPVTETVTGIDIVREQFAIASGTGLRQKQKDVHLTGHAIECRITSEDPTRSFLPTPGLVTKWVVPQGTDVRVDTHVFTGYTVPPYYDSLLAKVICRGDTRADALALMSRALDHFVVEGISTNISILKDIIADEQFVEGSVSTRWLETAFMPTWEEGSNG